MLVINNNSHQFIHCSLHCRSYSLDCVQWNPFSVNCYLCHIWFLSVSSSPCSGYLLYLTMCIIHYLNGTISTDGTDSCIILNPLQWSPRSIHGQSRKKKNEMKRIDASTVNHNLYFLLSLFYLFIKLSQKFFSSINKIKLNDSL